MTALWPSPEQIANWHFLSMILLGIVAAFLAIRWVLDRGIDLIVAIWNRRHRATVIDFEERRRTSLRRAMGGRS